jgi:hypothetical protein
MAVGEAKPSVKSRSSRMATRCPIARSALAVSAGKRQLRSSWAVEQSMRGAEIAGCAASRQSVRLITS